MGQRLEKLLDPSLTMLKRRTAQSSHAAFLQRIHEGPELASLSVILLLDHRWPDPPRNQGARRRLPREIFVPRSCVAYFLTKFSSVQPVPQVAFWPLRPAGAPLSERRPNPMPTDRESATRYKARNQGTAHHQIPADPPSFIGQPRLLRPHETRCVFRRHAPPLELASAPAATTNERSLRPTHPASPTDQIRKKESETSSVVMLQAANKPMNSHVARGGTRSAFQPLQTQGSPENIGDPSQFRTITTQSNGHTVDNVYTPLVAILELFGRTPHAGNAAAPHSATGAFRIGIPGQAQRQVVRTAVDGISLIGVRNAFHLVQFPILNTAKKYRFAQNLGSLSAADRLPRCRNIPQQRYARPVELAIADITPS